jgi:hypothetical protein
MSLKTIKAIFLISALYDILLGIVFGIFYKAIYQNFGVELPNHSAYIQLSALYIFIFGIGFYLVYKNPMQNRQIILLGILMKLAFFVVAVGHLVFDTIPSIYIPFAVLDIVFVLLFVPANSALKKMAPAV